VLEKFIKIVNFSEIQTTQPNILEILKIQGNRNSQLRIFGNFVVLFSGNLENAVPFGTGNV